MKLTDLKDLKKDRFYCLYDNSDNMKTVLIIQTSADVKDMWEDADDDHLPDSRWEIEGRCLCEYLSELKSNWTDSTDGTGVEEKEIELTVTDPDDYTDGFEFKDDDPVMFWELTDSEVAVHTINHI